jgi:hypothetical protein
LLFNIFGFGIEDIIFAFTIGGLAAVIYKEIFVKKEIKTKPEKVSHLILLGIFAVIIFFSGIYLFKLNSIYVTPIAFVITGIVILFLRRDLIKNAVVSGLLIAGVMFLGYILLLQFYPEFFNNFWQLQNISGVYFFKVPIEELIWGFSWGFLAGPYYEFWKGRKEK